MIRILKLAIAIATIAIGLAALFIITIPSAFSASVTGIPSLAIVAIVGLGAFIFVSVVYVYSFKSKR
ncbi:MAG: hypothetical protein ACFFFO_06635 [Candidatus Thorarchaeota archaeon]